MENLSIVTGFPFGRYHFEVAAALPHIGAVPIIVGLLYFAMGYFSWMIASLLLDDADRVIWTARSMSSPCRSSRLW